MVKVFQPNSPLLAKYIDCFYVFDTSQLKGTNYMVYPQTNTPLSFFKNAAVEVVGSHLQVKSLEQEYYWVDVVGRYTKPLLVSYFGPVQEFAVHFKPLGLNYFINRPFAEVAPKNSQPLEIDTWKEFASHLFKETDTIEQVASLELFLLSQFNEINIPYLHKVINKLTDPFNDATIAQLATEINMSSRTLQRQFNNYVGCTPAVFKRIARFRHSIDIAPINEELKNLVTIGYESGFYDQSYFGREYRALTGECPKDFFKEVSLISENKFAWKII